MMKNKICPLPWNHLSIQQNGDFRLCCQCVHPPFGKPGMRVQEHSINLVRNSDMHKRVRSQMLAGQEPIECQLCWNEEALGLTSKRLHMLKHYNIDTIQNSGVDGVIDTNAFPLQYIDIRFGNLCNLKCRTCGPPDSSLWYEDFVELNTPNRTEFDYYGTNRYQLEKINNVWALKNDDFNWYDNDEFWQTVTKIIPYVDRLYLTGGEPLVNKAQWRLLNTCVELGQSNKITLEYNSNMTKLPDFAKELWQQFKEVQIGCSIDAVGPLANYIRYPSEWADVEENIRQLGTIKNVTAKFSPTISVFNVLGFLEIVDWLQANSIARLRPIPSFHILHGPDYQNLTVLPTSTKQWIVSQYENWFSSSAYRNSARKALQPILDFMLQENNSHLLPKLKLNTEKLDRMRNQNVKNYLPWLAEILDKVQVPDSMRTVDSYW
jgi:organic radical activating enzyme